MSRLKNTTGFCKPIPIIGNGGDPETASLGIFQMLPHVPDHTDGDCAPASHNQLMKLK